MTPPPREDPPPEEKGGRPSVASFCFVFFSSTFTRVSLMWMGCVRNGKTRQRTRHKWTGIDTLHNQRKLHHRPRQNWKLVLADVAEKLPKRFRDSRFTTIQTTQLTQALKLAHNFKSSLETKEGVWSTLARRQRSPRSTEILSSSPLCAHRWLSSSLPTPPVAQPPRQSIGVKHLASLPPTNQSASSIVATFLSWRCFWAS